MNNPDYASLCSLIALLLFLSSSVHLEAKSRLNPIDCDKQHRCLWTWEELEIDDDTKIDGREDECIVGEVRDEYFMQSINAQITAGSMGWAYDDSNVCGEAAQAVAMVQSDAVIKFRFIKKCKGCKGKVFAYYDPEMSLCANIYNPPSYAFMAGLMAARSSVADDQIGTLEVFQGTAEASAEGHFGDGQGRAEFRVFAAPLSVTFRHGNGNADVGRIGGAPTVFFYTVDASTRYEILFLHTAALKVDVLANSGFLDVGEGHAKSGSSSWGAIFELWCSCHEDWADEPSYFFEIQYREKASKIDCSR